MKNERVEQEIQPSNKQTPRRAASFSTAPAEIIPDHRSTAEADYFPDNSSSDAPPEHKRDLLPAPRKDFGEVAGEESSGGGANLAIAEGRQEGQATEQRTSYRPGSPETKGQLWIRSAGYST